MFEKSRAPVTGEKRRRTKTSQRTRYRLACARCQKRKIKCDDQVPECGNCKSSGEPCFDGESSRLGPLKDPADVYIAKVQSRMRCLEALINTRLPDVDLSKLHLIPHGHNHSDCAPTHNSHVDTSPTLVMDEASVVSETPVVTSSAPRVEPDHPPTDEIGLMTLNGTQDPRYIGPSSGQFLIRMLMSTAVTRRRALNSSTANSVPPQDAAALPTALVEALHGPLPLPSIDHAMKMVNAFFEIVHPLYPILSEAATVTKLESLRFGYETDAYSIFQVFMVLAIGATLLSHRHRVRLPSESYCLSALQYFHQLNVGDSVQGLQCLLLLQVYTMHCPHMKLNIWYLNYHCLSVTVDLGLQKDLGSNSGVSPAEQELRTRLFWVVMTLDRKIAIMMGRPIGLRDEACDLRLPRGASDDDAAATRVHGDGRVGDNMAYSAHMFRLTQLKTEYKYVANSVVRDAPSFAYPAIVNMVDWQRDLVGRIDQWISNIPPCAQKEQRYLHCLAHVQGLDLKIAALRPSLANPVWTPGSAAKCQEAAQLVLKLFDQLYRQNSLIYSWDVMHSVTMAMATMLCSARASPSLCNSDSLSLTLDLGLCLLSVCGEHWSGAKRCRDIMEELGKPFISSLRDMYGAGSSSSAQDVAPVAGQSGTGDVMIPTPLMGSALAMSEGAMGAAFQAGSSGVFDGWFLQDMSSEDMGLGGDPENMDNLLRHWFDGVVSAYPSQ